MDDLKTQVKDIFATKWQTREGRQVPEPEDVKLGNDAVTIKGAVLYADLAESTNLVDNYKPHFAAEVYKSFLHCASKVIRAEGGVITAFDGDRVMAVFIGDYKNTTAARCALKINHCVEKIINPALKAEYPSTDFTVRHAVGVDVSDLFVARTGIRGSNDLVWVGRAANYAAKLSAERAPPFASFITKDVYEAMHDSAKLSNNGTGEPMWEKCIWDQRDIAVYRSSWMWTP